MTSGSNAYWPPLVTTPGRQLLAEPLHPHDGCLLASRRDFFPRQFFQQLLSGHTYGPRRDQERDEFALLQIELDLDAVVRYSDRTKARDVDPRRWILGPLRSMLLTRCHVCVPNQGECGTSPYAYNIHKYR